MVPFERGKMSSYRLPIVTFSLSLRLSEILPLLCSRTPFFPLHLQCPPNFPMFPSEQVDVLWATKSEGVGIIVRAISFQDFQPMWSWSTNVTDRRTVNMRSYYRALHYSASRGKNQRLSLRTVLNSANVSYPLAKQLQFPHYRGTTHSLLVRRFLKQKLAAWS